MSRSYYVIELSARWLTVLLIALALVMVIAFALGYGAAWSVLTAEETTGEMTALQAAATLTEIPEVVIPDSVSTPAAEPTETPPPSPTATPSPEPTKPPTPQPTPTAAVTKFFVQVLASAKQQSVDAAQVVIGSTLPSLYTSDDLEEADGLGAIGEDVEKVYDFVL
ncbi:MAG: hypothetical protein IFJ96_04605, partial [Acidobacteria bacterium]|nr:hypothetical protein [Candidatus Sulfomarinibacter sp. MAG AM2]